MINVTINLKFKKGAAMMCFCLCSWVGGGTPSVHSY